MVKNPPVIAGDMGSITAQGRSHMPQGAKQLLKPVVWNPCSATRGTTIVRSLCVCTCAHSPVRLFATPWTVAHQAPLSMGFPRQEYWSGLPIPPPEDLPELGIQPKTPASPALAGRFFTFASPEKPRSLCTATKSSPRPLQLEKTLSTTRTTQHSNE